MKLILRCQLSNTKKLSGKSPELISTRWPEFTRFSLFSKSKLRKFRATIYGTIKKPKHSIRVSGVHNSDFLQLSSIKILIMQEIYQFLKPSYYTICSLVHWVGCHLKRFYRSFDTAAQNALPPKCCSLQTEDSRNSTKRDDDWRAGAGKGICLWTHTHAHTIHAFFWWDPIQCVVVKVAVDF